MPYASQTDRNKANRRWRARNPESSRASARESYSKAYALAPAAVNARAVRWQAANRPKRNALAARRRAAMFNATPVWADPGKIAAVYVEAKAMTEMLGEPWHVDHIFPLCGRQVSGLHVHQNLQILPGSENARKSNKLLL